MKITKRKQLHKAIFQATLITLGTAVTAQAVKPLFGTALSLSDIMKKSAVSAANSKSLLGVAKTVETRSQQSALQRRFFEPAYTLAPAGADDRYALPFNLESQVTSFASNSSGSSLYAVYNDFSGSDPVVRVKIYRTSEQAWTEYGSDNGLVGATGGSVRPVIGLNSSGTRYVAYADENNALRVKKYDGGDWLLLPGSAVTGYADFENFSMVFDPLDGNPVIQYVTYNSTIGQNSLQIKKFNSTTSAWETLGGSTFNAQQVEFDGASTVISSDRFAYTLLLQNGNRKPKLMKTSLAAPASVTQVGNNAIIDSAVLSAKLLMSPDKQKFAVAFFDEVNHAIHIRALDNASNWKEVSTITGVYLEETESSAIEYSILMEDDGTFKATYVDRANNKTVYRSSNGTGWSSGQSSPVSGLSRFHKLYRAGSKLYAVLNAEVTSGQNGFYMPNVIQSLNEGSGQWSSLGNIGFADSFVDNLVSSADNDGNLYALYADVLNGRKISLSKFNGNSWQILRNDIGDEESNSLCITVNKVTKNPVYAYYDRPTQSIITTEYSAGAIPSQYVGSANDISIQSDNSGNIHMVYSNDDGKPVYTKFNGVEWVSPYVLTDGSTTYDELDEIAMHVDAATNKVFVAVTYENEDDESKKTYVHVVNNGQFEVLQSPILNTNNLSVKTDLNNKLYVAYSDESHDGKASVVTLDGNTWVNFGDAGFTDDKVSKIDLAFDGDNTPHLFYTVRGGNAVYRKYIDSNWEFTGSTVVGPTNSSVTLSGDKLYMVYTNSGMAFAKSAAVTAVSEEFAITYNGGQDAIVPVPENQTTVATVTVNETNGITFTLEGLDKDLFEISTSGELKFKSAPNFEQPASVAQSNTYSVIVKASNGTIEDSQTITVSVQNLQDELTIAADQPLVIPKSDLTPPSDWAEDGLRFILPASPAVLSAISFGFSSPADPDFTYGGFLIDELELKSSTAGNYFFTVIFLDATDNEIGRQTIDVIVTPPNRVPVITFKNGESPALISFNPLSTREVAIITASDEDNDALTYSLLGDDKDLFSIGQDGKLNFNTPPDYNLPADQDSDNKYLVTVKVTDGRGGEITQDITVKVREFALPPVTITYNNGDAKDLQVNENSFEPLATITIDPSYTEPVSYELSGADAALFTISSSGELSFRDMPDYEQPKSAEQSNLYKLTVKVKSDDSEDEINLTVKIKNIDDTIMLSLPFVTEWTPVGDDNGMQQDNSSVSVLNYAGSPYSVTRSSDGRIIVRRFTGSVWEQLGEAVMIGMQPQITMDQNGVMTMAYLTTAFQIKVKKYIDNEWVDAVSQEAIGSTYAFSLSDNKYGQSRPYVAFKRQSDNSTVIRTLVNSEWIDMPIVGLPSMISNLTIKVDKLGTPYLLYSEYSSAGETIRMSRWDQVEAMWTQAGTFPFAANGSASLNFGRYNEPYISYVERVSPYGITVEKLNNQAWEVVGERRFSGTNAQSPQLSISEDGIPYVSFVQSGKISTKYYDNGTWELAGELQDLDLSEANKFSLDVSGQRLFFGVSDLSAQKTKITYIDAVNTRPTAITLSNYRITENNAAGEEIGTFSATSTVANDTFTYELAENAPDNSFFRIEGDKLIAGAVFDKETRSSFFIKVRVTNSKNKTLVKEIDINVKNVMEILTKPELVTAGNKTTKASFSGKVEPNAYVNLYLNGSSTPAGGIEASADGTWEYELPDLLEHGDYSLRVTATDTQENVSELSEALTFSVDTQVPEVLMPEIAGINPAGYVTVKKPTINGKAEPGSTVKLVTDSTNVKLILVGDSGEWTYTFEEELMEGGHTSVYSVTDAAGNAGEQAPVLTFHVDTKAPEKPSVALLDGSNSTLTRNSKPLLSGTGEAGTSMVIYIGGNELITVDVNQDGKWSYQFEQSLTEQDYEVALINKDSAGNASVKSDALIFKVDTTAPSTSMPVVPALTNVNKPIVKGKTETGGTVVIYLDGQELQVPVSVDADGNWSYTFINPLEDGNYSLTYTTSDVAGNRSAKSAEARFEIDTKAPAIPAIPVLADADNGLTYDTTPTISGQAEANGKVVIYGTGGARLGEAAVDGNGNWSYTFSELTTGLYSVSVTAVDGAGNSSGKSQVLNFNVEEKAPNSAPTLSAIADIIMCYTGSDQKLDLRGISAGAEIDQTTELSVSADNVNLFDQLLVSQIGTEAGRLNYRIRQDFTGTATITVTVKDNGGTERGGQDTFSRTFTITVNPLPVATISSDMGTSISKGKTAHLLATGGVSYTWADANGILSGQTSSSLTVRPDRTTVYKVTVANESGCSVEKEIRIEVLEDYKAVDATNILSPNGDGVNDNFIIRNIDMYPNNLLRIYDRAGREVYSKGDYRNEWTGTLKGNPLAEGTYYYILDFGKGKSLKGFITIVNEQ